MVESVSSTTSTAAPLGLTYTTDRGRGLRRRRGSHGFSYRDSRGQVVRDRRTLERIRALAIPPAWLDVWICERPSGHLQATGLDSRGRKQYRYHEKWRAARDAEKFSRMLGFGRRLPGLRRALARDLRASDATRDTVAATAVLVLDLAAVRIGNDRYRRENGTFGITTLQKRHVGVSGTDVSLKFRGKGGSLQRLTIRDTHLAGAVTRCLDLPGKDLFQYVDATGRHTLGSAHVNDYLKRNAGEEFTAKDFRTWSATVLAAGALRQALQDGPPTARRANAALASVAERLGHTVAICRTCYVHPAIVAAYFDIRLASTPGTPAKGLRRDEALVLGLLEAG